MISRLVHQQYIVTPQHQLAIHHAPLFTARQDIHRLFHVITREQQASQNRAHGLIIIALLSPLPHPVSEGFALGKFLGRVLRHVTDVGIFGPLDHATVRLQAGNIATDTA